MSLTALADRAAGHALDIFGTLAARREDGLGDGTIALLGPREPGFWRHVTAMPEFTDGKRDPLDRWSARVIGAVAEDLGGVALFPFGEPVLPFFSWATLSGRAWQSPVMLLVHDRAGLMVSYRGAVFLPQTHRPEPPRVSPCVTCPGKPCLSACPAGALTGEGYDLVACHGYLDTPAGVENLSRGCAVRRACPVSQNYGRSEKQSAFHMEQFHPCR
ncbi:MAG: ferredoxin [Silicimonas sp.]|nr:ferredoxin [Silicimonas sp.]